MTPRTAAKVDANQKEIVAALRRIGATVQCLHMVGHGCPDLLVGWHGENILMEVKMTSGDMTPDELEIEHGVQSALARADRELYRAKREGRNRVCVAS